MEKNKICCKHPQTQGKRKRGETPLLHEASDFSLVAWKFSIPNIIGSHYFCPGLIALPKNISNTQTYSSPLPFRPDQKNGDQHN
jgi:hypothetical protein